ncbi:MBL fold metallo-hydrolase [Streptomyces sp. NPDC059979]|uniref:MBL fold metallo-hydrolase n=1 Tax=Streptomyces sp. NPDC059979 TaxID=3347021 RepID=UPI00369FE0C0
MTALGDLIEIDDETVLVRGQELDVEHGRPDVANALVHRVGDTLVLVDTGVTAAFRAALREAADRVGPWSRALVLTTHGHLDHVGNNDLADELGVPAEHYVPAPDLDQMRDPAGYWVRSFERIAGLAPLPAPPALAGRVVSLFEPMRPFGATTRTYEERPLERIRIGSTRFTGWTFADGAVRVLRSQGHCAGHVIVHLSDCGILHLSDEGNGPCGAMVDADQLKIQTVLGAVALLFEEGGAALLTDGHTFAVRRGAEVVSYLDGLLEQATALQEAALTLTGESRQIRPGAFATRYAEAAAGLGGGGANPNTMFTAMTAVNQLRELGLRPESGGGDAPWSRPALRNPAPPDGP